MSAAPSESAFLLLLYHALFSVCCSGVLAGLLAGRSGVSEEGSGTIRQTPGTLDTLGHNPDIFLIALCSGNGCLMPPKQQQKGRDTQEMNCQF